jgi:hypothetical protein
VIPFKEAKVEHLSIRRSNYTLVPLLLIVIFSLTLLNCAKKEEPAPPPPPPPPAAATVEKSIEERVSDLESELFIIKLSTEVLPTETSTIGPEDKGYNPSRRRRGFKSPDAK